MRQIEELQFPLVFRKEDATLHLSAVQTLFKNHIGRGQPDDLIRGWISPILALSRPV